MRKLLRGAAIVGGIVATVWTVLAPATSPSLMMARTFAIMAVTGMAWVGAGLTPAVMPDSMGRRWRLTIMVVVGVTAAGVAGLILSVQVRQAAWDRCAARVGLGSPLIPDKCGPYPR